MENPSEPIIFLEGVNIANDDGVVIRDLSLSVERGGFIYIVGKVGSGKSTIIKSLIAEWPIKSGIARVGDFNLVKMKRRMIPHLRRSVGVVFQDFQLICQPLGIATAKIHTILREPCMQINHARGRRGWGRSWRWSISRTN